MVLETLLVLLLGLAFGSFLGAVTWRIPRRQNFSRGRSLCPKCGRVIAWFDNLPLVSFILLGGRCRHCRRKISLRYPLIEGATAAAFLLFYLFLKKCPSPETLCSWQNSFGVAGVLIVYLLLVITVAIFVIDLENRIIPDGLIFGGFVLTLLPLILNDKGDLYLHLFASFGSALFLLALHLATKGRGMGLGDVKYALFPGLFFGWPLALVWLFVAFLTGAAVAIILILTGKAHRKDKIAFGPFMALSFVITSFWGASIIRWLVP